MVCFRADLFVETGMNEMFICWWIYSVEFDCCDDGDDSDCKVQPGDFLPQVVWVAWVELDGKPEPYPREPWGGNMSNCNIFYCYLDFLVELLSGHMFELNFFPFFLVSQPRWRCKASNDHIMVPPVIKKCPPQLYGVCSNFRKYAHPLHVKEGIITEKVSQYFLRVFFGLVLA